MTPTLGLSEAAVAYLREHGIEIRFRIKNNAVDYSIINKPDPTETGLHDGALAVCVVHAGSEFKFVKGRKIDTSERVQAMRLDGSTIVYDESIRIDWSNGSIVSSRGRDMTLRILSIVVKNMVPPDDGKALLN